MARFGVTALVYGVEAFADIGRMHDIVLTSFDDDAYIDAKMFGGLYWCDEFVRAAKVETAPL
ncbi:hypothetical protein FHW79_004524 [Azospirillum sp. OGB3]|uniref:hypothetical protein n=1 Tax=Azospirillum sp. OGB3 TaxID=2587012 RepID=UPI0016066004|nr:hypothetical protein [Azospirillum sp. OGB3]MBB3266875.1 hypothetical protein [Azospirillum sp. OGB3]